MLHEERELLPNVKEITDTQEAMDEPELFFFFFFFVLGTFYWHHVRLFTEELGPHPGTQALGGELCEAGYSAGGGGWHGTRAMRQPLLSGTYSPCKHGFHPSLSWALQPHIMHKTKRPFEGKPPRMTWCALNASTQLDPTTAPFSSHCQLSLSF